MDLLRVQLQVPASSRRAVTHFYASTLGLGLTAEAAHEIGHSTLAFEPHTGTPFYHFAIQLPGDRFTAATHWARQRVQTLSDPIHFNAWNADAIYFHNIVELIAHHGHGETGRHGPFNPSEFLGISEIGLVGDVDTITTDLAPLELNVFSGAGTDLTFLGAPTGTLIITAIGRGWLPLQRPAQPHPVHATIAGTPKTVIHTAGHTVRRTD
ncbi:hypothetical protein [Conexibacter sp. DBS9H8]|uniref:hypothetical protein n=1 Tax=Conexibacter sp. DBS9H8 TaxID=2937801 RepID=UPI00200D2D28|nr:hypothetical protein [Conexibacter sp. DBS9H8]